MSTATLRPALARPRVRFSYPVRVLAVVAWAVVALALAPWFTDAFVWWSGAGLALVALWPFARAWRRGLDPGDAMWCFASYFLLAMLLRGMGVLTFVDSRYLRVLGDPSSPAYRQLAGWMFFYCALGFAALNAAYHAPFARRWAEAYLARPSLLSAPWRTSRIVPVGLALLGVGGIGALMRLHSLGGFASAAADPLAANQGALGYFWQIALTEFAVVGFHVLVIGAMLRGDRRLPWIWLGLGLLLSVPLYLVSSSKALLIRVLFTPMLFWHFLRKPLRLGHVLGFFGGFVLLFPLFYAYRSLGIAGLDGVGLYLETTDAPWLKFYNRAYDADSFMRVLHAINHGLVPLQWGRSLLDLFTFFIPRAWWAAKPDSFGLCFAPLYMPEVDWGGMMTYVSPSLPGELFLNFHVFGVLAGFLLLGWSLRAAVTLARGGGAGAVLLYGYFFLAAVHLVEGSIAAQIEFFLSSAFPALVALALLRGPCALGAPTTESA